MINKIILTIGLTVLLSSSMATTPSEVYDFQLMNIFSKIEKEVIKEKGIATDIPFEVKRNAIIKPKDVYVLIFENYLLMQDKWGLETIQTKKISNVLPKDVFNLSKEVNQKLLRVLSSSELSITNQKKYIKWKAKYRDSGNSIIPGDVFFLSTYLRFLLLKL